MKMEGDLEFEPFNYEEEFNNFDHNLSQTLTRFTKINEEVDMAEAESYLHGSMEDLNEALQNLINCASNNEKVSAAYERERKEIDCVVREIGDILAQRDSSSRRLEKANEEALKKKRELARHQTQATSSRDLIEEKKGKLGVEMEKWKDALGLNLVLSTHGGIIFNFSNIIRQSPERQFSCEIKGIIF